MDQTTFRQSVEAFKNAIQLRICPTASTVVTPSPAKERRKSLDSPVAQQPTPSPAKERRRSILDDLVAERLYASPKLAPRQSPDLATASSGNRSPAAWLPLPAPDKMQQLYPKIDTDANKEAADKKAAIQAAEEQEVIQAAAMKQAAADKATECQKKRASEAEAAKAQLIKEKDQTLKITQAKQHIAKSKYDQLVTEKNQQMEQLTREKQQALKLRDTAVQQVKDHKAELKSELESVKNEMQKAVKLQKQAEKATSEEKARMSAEVEQLRKQRDQLSLAAAKVSSVDETKLRKRIEIELKAEMSNTPRGSPTRAAKESNQKDKLKLDVQQLKEQLSQVRDKLKGETKLKVEEGKLRKRAELDFQNASTKAGKAEQELKSVKTKSRKAANSDGKNEQLQGLKEEILLIKTELQQAKSARADEIKLKREKDEAVQLRKETEVRALTVIALVVTVLTPTVLILTALTIIVTVLTIFLTALTHILAVLTIIVTALTHILTVLTIIVAVDACQRGSTADEASVGAAQKGDARSSSNTQTD